MIVVLVCLIAIAVCLLPMMNVLAVSLSSKAAITRNLVYFWPVDLDLEAYKSVFNDSGMRHTLWLSVVVTVTSTLFCMLMTTLCAYPLSQRRFPGRALFNTLIILTMYFNAGMIPDYLNIKRLGLLNNFWVMVLPAGISVFNMIILKSFFRNIPESLQESAEMEGASHWTILSRIYLPLSTPALATIALFYAVGRWNGFQDVRLYVTDPKLYTIQFRLYQIIMRQASTDANMEGVQLLVDSDSIRAASVMFATIPILAVYPWLQRYFVSGVTIGAVKG
jgi:putative aldouronate transport system permease protein